MKSVGTDPAPGRATPRAAVPWALCLAAMLVGAVALHGAVRWYGHPIAGVLVTADGVVSSVGMPDWDGVRQGLRFPDRMVAVDGAPLAPAAGASWDEAVAAAAAAGHAQVVARVQGPGRTRDATLSITRLGAGAWWLYAGGTLFVAALYVLAAVAALMASPHGALSRAFAKFALLAALFLATFFDAHTARTLTPLFYLAFAWGPFALVQLALRLPDDVALLQRVPVLPRLLDVAGGLLGVALALHEVTGQGAPILVSASTLILGGAILFFVVVVGMRSLRAQGPRRQVMTALVRAIVPPYALVGVGVLATMRTSVGSTAAFFAIPALALAPIATAVASIRHDLWGCRALLSRVVTRTVSGAIICAAAIGLGAAFATSLGMPFAHALAAAAVGAALAAPLVHLGLLVVDRSFFGARAQYKPTIAQLSEELTSITAVDQVAAAVERTVRRWLPCDHVEFALAAADEDGQPPAAASFELALPASFGDRTLGYLRTGPKRGRALFTTDDLDLLTTIANQAALALAHAEKYAELDERRRCQVAAWQAERGLLVETMAAEVAHEVRYPINFFRSVFTRGATSGQLDAEEIDIGCEEVDRLERLVAGLRRPAPARVERRHVAVAEIAARSEMLLRDALGDRPLELEVPPGAALRCDSDQVTQIVVNLLSNALDACGATGRAGLQWRVTAGGAELVAWDDGPGFEGNGAQLFTPWFTTKTRGTGLGLAIAQRLARAHGWSIEVGRADGTTRFSVTIPGRDVAGPQDPPAAGVPSSDWHVAPAHPVGSPA